MKSKVGIAELKSHLSEYVRAAQRGKEIIISDRETPVAKLSPVGPQPPAPARRRRGVSWADVDRILDTLPPGPVVPPDVLQRVVEQDKEDAYDKWVKGELT